MGSEVRAAMTFAQVWIVLGLELIQKRRELRLVPCSYGS